MISRSLLDNGGKALRGITKLHERPIAKNLAHQTNRVKQMLKI